MDYKVIDFAGEIPETEFGSKAEALNREDALHSAHGFGNKGLPRFAVMYEEVPGVWGFDFQTAPDADPDAVAKLKASLA